MRGGAPSPPNLSGGDAAGHGLIPLSPPPAGACMLTANEIRHRFLEYFKKHGHTEVASSSLIPRDDPSLLFTNAGMVQFKKIFCGQEKRDYVRATTSQKCLRVGGKHNDLDNVGRTARHHTFFEMLGNFSFGDYFKEDAIRFAWTFITEDLKLPKDRLYITVYKDDDEAFELWQKVAGVAPERIFRLGEKDNFWSMGDTGPCGPCSEIHFDQGADMACGPDCGIGKCDCDRFLEIWNLVFMQFNRKADGSLEGLPAKVIDTGMGFERLVRTLQGKTSNYDTDVFQPILKAIGDMAGKKYGEDEKSDIAMRVIADHIRTIAFSITDGQLPSNAKAGYVIRRILRRAVRYGYTFLGQKQAFMYKLLPVLIENMGAAYPELDAQKELIAKVIKEEEDSFLRTLETGIRLLEKTMADAKAAGKNEISGKDAFTLYDTFGFPLDLTELILRENGMTADIKEFDAEMQQQKQRARNAAAIETGDWITLKEGTTEFVGYDYTEYETSILRYRQVKQKNQTLYQIVLDKTPFYAESGGQVGDTGVLVNEFETIEVVDTKKENNLPIHITKKLPEHMEAPMMACVDTDKRAACAANHSATHLLDAALREVLGEHVEQKGSLVTPDSLRFDFSHFQKVTDEEIRKVEHIVNAKIRANIPLKEYRNIPIEEAKELGAIALFGEKYGDHVRVIQFGSSVEFCGGTHVAATGNIGMVKIISESSVAAGVRRIEAYTGARVEELMNTIEDTLHDLKALFNNAPDLAGTIRKYIDENAGLKKQVEDFMKEKEAQLKERLLKNVQEVNGVKVIKFCAPLPAETVKNIAFQLRGQITENLFFVAGTEAEGKPMLTVMLSDNLVAGGLKAGNLVKEAAKLIQGGGGGQPHFATAGGKNADGLNAAIDKVLELAGL